MKKIFFILASVILLLSSCGTEIDPSDRLIYEKPELTGKNMLIEDFTGQNCINCPRAAGVISDLMKTYGEDKIIAVAIHSKPLGIAAPEGLMTDFTNAYATHYGVEYQPVGMVNREYGLQTDDQWTGMVKYFMQDTAKINITVEPTYDDATRQSTANVQVVSLEGTATGKLQVWLVEDSIIAKQMMPDGMLNKSYVHNHVLRASYNGQWGEDITAAEGQTVTKSYSLTIDKDYDAKQCAIVAFIYNDSGVLQAVRSKKLKK
ncbi:Omp28 family outer membrane lipoprotein [Prevotella sp. AGR2160]|uniref:Omp28 family outer membrane lipoprotein n=1 Tax=Prevotella sp. AGR2160 TaxID=1280674 RepID=UPI0003F80BC2|nr:Omp28 family outer membrane lipoprotein [Prevotella sp. AGR2160]